MTKTAEDKEKEQRTEHLQTRYMEFQILTQQVQKSKEQLHQLDQQMNELDAVKENLEELKSVKEGTSIFVPVANGIFMQANAATPEKVILNVGSQTAVEKTIPEAQELISDQMMQAGKIKEQLMGNLNKLIERSKEIQKELEMMVKEHV